MLRRDPGRPLTSGEQALAMPMFGTAIDYGKVRLHCARWWPLQPRTVVMAPTGGIWFHPEGGLWRDDFAVAPQRLQALLIHELTHVWQHQRGLFLPLRRHPFSRYTYTLVPGRPLIGYGIEQQAMIVEHAFTARCAQMPAAALERLVSEIRSDAG
jgi:hypothetical protein